MRDERLALGEDLGGPVGLPTNGKVREEKAKVPAKRMSSKPAGPSKNRAREQQKAERAVEAAEAAMLAVEDELANPAQWISKYEAAKSEARHTAAKLAVEAAYERLEALQG